MYFFVISYNRPTLGLFPSLNKIPLLFPFKTSNTRKKESNIITFSVPVVYSVMKPFMSPIISDLLYLIMIMDKYYGPFLLIYPLTIIGNAAHVSNTM